MATASTFLGMLVLVVGITSASSAEDSCPQSIAGSSLMQKEPETKVVSPGILLEEDADLKPSRTLASSKLIKSVVAEFIAMTLFVIFGCGSAMGIAKEPGSAWVLQVSLTFGLAITVLAYSIGHYSGGQINCAVTLGLVLTKQVSIMQGICNVIAQLMGSVTGAMILSMIYPKGKDRTGGYGSNGVGDGWTRTNALVGEVVATFLLMYTVLETAVNPASNANRALACVAIGFAVFLAHSVLIPIDGCSINPTRSFGPALVAKYLNESDTFSDMWIFWIGPLLGAALAAGAYTLMTS